jgi:predicted PurR-regulated permease PerM
VAVSALAFVAMALSVAYVGTQLVSKATDATRDVAASTQKLANSIRKIENHLKEGKE